jgi:hypothetical protein
MSRNDDRHKLWIGGTGSITTPLARFGAMVQLTWFVHLQERYSVTEKVKSADRHRRPNTATIIKAAKAAGCASVAFPDGTIVSITPAPNADRSATEVDRWSEANAS